MPTSFDPIAPDSSWDDPSPSDPLLADGFLDGIDLVADRTAGRRRKPKGGRKKRRRKSKVEPEGDGEGGFEVGSRAVESCASAELRQRGVRSEGVGVVVEERREVATGLWMPETNGGVPKLEKELSLDWSRVMAEHQSLLGGPGTPIIPMTPDPSTGPGTPNTNPGFGGGSPNTNPGFGGGGTPNTNPGFGGGGSPNTNPGFGGGGGGPNTNPGFGGGGNPSPNTNPGNAGTGQRWCVASQSASETALQVALDYACGYGGTDCSAINQGGNCYNPDTLRDHASYAFNQYYQKNPAPTSCDFGGTATLTNTDPSTQTCQFPSSR